MTFYFPDLSYYEPGAKIGEILKQSGGVLCIRAGHGDFKDPKFDEWRAQANASPDLKVLMIYHFVDKADGAQQSNAILFRDMVGGKRNPKEVLVMDVESGSGAWTLTECESYRRLVQGYVGGPPLMIYANQGYITERKLGPLFTKERGWIAKWGKAGTDTSPPTYNHIAWQHAADGFGKPRTQWAGTDKTTDENRVDGMTQDQFARTILGSSPPPPSARTDCSS